MGMWLIHIGAYKKFKLAPHYQGWYKSLRVTLKKGPFRESNPGPVRPERTIIPLDQTDILAMYRLLSFKSVWGKWTRFLVFTGGELGRSEMVQKVMICYFL